MDLYVSPIGNDKWSGRLPQPNPDKTDGPLATLDGAKAALARLFRPQPTMPDPRACTAAWPGQVTVLIRGGRYELSAPLVFRPQDSMPVTFKAYPGETPIFDGGVRISGFREETINGVQVWVTEIPDVAAGKWYFRQLFVNGRRATRSRFPKQGFYRVGDPLLRGKPAGWQTWGHNQFQAAPGDMRAWKNLQDVEVVALHYWIEERLPVASYDEQTRVVTSTCRTRSPLTLSWGGEPAIYFVENVFEALSEGGDWYLDRPSGKLYYVPREGETIESAEVYAPRLHQLLQLLGQPDQEKYVQWLRFEGLTFRHAETGVPVAETLPAHVTLGSDPRRRPADLAASPQAACDVPGVIHLRGAHHCAIEDCVIEHVGWYGLELEDGCRGIRVIGNTITDMGAGGIKVGGCDAAGPVARRTGENRITDNVICDGGHVFQSGVGVLMRHTFGNILAHNHIHDLYYSAVSSGWVWGYAESVTRDNIIEFNHIHDLGKGWLSDMGGIYTLGVQPGTVIRNNHIHDITCTKYGGWAIYPDEGTSHVIIENNVSYRTNSAVFHQHYGRENVVRNNIWAFGHEGCVALSRQDKHQSFTFVRNIVLSDGDAIYTGGYGCNMTDRPRIEADLNLLWCMAGDLTAATNKWEGGKTDPNNPPLDWKQWQANGQDPHSLVADPRFADPANGDFTLASDSPAWPLGFKPIDLSTVGPRPKEQRS